MMSDPASPLTTEVAQSSPVRRSIPQSLQIYYTHKLGNLFFAFFFQIFVAKTLNPDGYATYAILLAILMAAERFLSFGVDRTIMRFVPSLTSHANFSALRWLLIRLSLVRIASVALMIVAIFLTERSLENFIPNKLSSLTIYAFSIWYVSYALLADADALAQSWMTHLDVAVAATLEILARGGVIFLLAICGYSIDANLVIIICASTSATSLVGLVIRFLCIRGRLAGYRANSAQHQYPAVDVKKAPMFAAAAYASTLGWLITSPAVVRIVAKGGLDVLEFASFSFIQALSISLQRGFPGLLILPSLEPVMAKLSGATERWRMFAIMSLIFKIELIAVMAIIIITAIAGADLISMLSRAAYAPYFFVLPILLVVLIIHTIYRICEIVMSVELEHRVFLALWPLSLISVGALYLTVGRWGLASVMLIPIVEGTVRVAIILISYRRTEIWRALDPARSFQISLSALAVLLVAIIAQQLHTPISDVGLVIISLVVFFGAMFAVRPFRPPEVERFLAMLPISMRTLIKPVQLLIRE